MKQINRKRAILENGVLRKEVKFGFSRAAFLLGFIYPLIKEDYITAGITFVVISTAGIIFFPLIFVLSIIFGFIYNKMYAKSLIKQGWYPFTKEDAQVLRMNGILFNDKNNFYENNKERGIKEAKTYETQQSEKNEITEFEENADNSYHSNLNVPKTNYKNRTIQKFIARLIGGGLVSLVSGVFTANIILILLGVVLTGGGAFLAVKNKDKIKWK